MKKLFFFIVIAGTLWACENAEGSIENTKDSLDSIAKVKKDAIDSTADARIDRIDSTTESKKDALDGRDTGNRRDTSKRR
jgi:hypothetical protein